MFCFLDYNKNVTDYQGFIFDLYLDMDLILMESAAILRRFNTSFNNFLENQRHSDASRRQSDTSYPCNFRLETHQPEDNIILKSDPKTSSQLDQEDLLLRIIEREDGLAGPGKTPDEAEGRVDGNKKEASGISESFDGSDLTMDVIGCLSDNTQQAIKGFSIKKETEHLVLSFPFMADILRKLTLKDGTKSTRMNHLTPMMLCDHSLRLTSSHRAAVTLAPDFERLVLCVVQFTIYRNNTEEGVRQHYKHLLSVISQDLPKMHLQFPRIVILDNSTDTEAISTLCTDLWRSMSPSCHRRTHITPLMFGVTRLNTGVFQQCVDDTYTALSEQDRDRFLSLIKLLLSTKCSPKEMIKTEKLLGNKIVPAAIREFWMIWGHELLKPLIFPVAKATWDSEDHDDSAGISWKTLFYPSWRALDKTNSNPQKKRKVMKGVIQEVVKRLKGQVTQVTSKQPMKSRQSLCRCDFCCRHTIPISSTSASST